MHRADHPDADALHRAAIAAAPDPRLRAMLATATVTVAAENPPWAASHGSVQGYAVAVALCAEDLAAVDVSHSLRDQLVRAFAAAVAASRHHALSSKAASRELLAALAGRCPADNRRFGNWSGSVPARVPRWFAYPLEQVAPRIEPVQPAAHRQAPQHAPSLGALHRPAKDPRFPPMESSP